MKQYACYAWADLSGPFFLLLVFLIRVECGSLVMNWQTAVEQTVTGLGYDLVEVEWGQRGLLQVFIDKLAQDPTGEFITVEDCEKVTRQLQHVLEVENCVYERLEVSSPGLDRPLTRLEHYQRFAGQEIDVILKVAFQGRKKYRGVLQVAPVTEQWRIVFDQEGGGTALDFALNEVREVRLVPVLDFKGRRFLPSTQSTGSQAAPVDAENDGGGDE
jgi:ribosome maturation factor RimP